MNILIAGIHGVGKTFLASQLPVTLGLIHTSASNLIKEERTVSNWGDDKRVYDANANQLALVSAVERYNSAGSRLLLDGHFVLLNARGEFLRLGTEVFRSLQLDGVILLESDPPTIANRISERDDLKVDIAHLVEFIVEERTQAQIVCDELGIPLIILLSPSLDSFVEVVTKIARQTAQ